MLVQSQTDEPITKIGAYKSKFHKDLTGLARFCDRNREAKNDKSVLHFVPDLLGTNKVLQRSKT